MSENTLHYLGRRGVTYQMHHHIVRRGDSLHKIAKRHGKSVRRLIHLNPHIAHRPHRIYPGEHIRLH